MSTIGELVKNIYKYGNCKIYLPVQNPKGVRAISFTVDKDGKLNISQFLGSYDRPFWNGNKKREDAVLERSIEALKYKEKDFILVLSVIAYASFYKCQKELTCDEQVSPKLNTNEVVRKLYKIVYSMFQYLLVDRSY